MGQGPNEAMNEAMNAVLSARLDGPYKAEIIADSPYVGRHTRPVSWTVLMWWREHGEKTKIVAGVQNPHACARLNTSQVCVCVFPIHRQMGVDVRVRTVACVLVLDMVVDALTPARMLRAFVS